MDRVANTIRGVPTSLRNRRPVNTLEGDRETFERLQMVSINKAVNTQETPLKEKHARSILSWVVRNSVLSWKFCNLLHKLLRDGHPNVLQDSSLQVTRLKELGRMWNHLHDHYGQLVATYIMLIMKKIDFHIKRPVFPPGLAMTDKELDAAGENDINTFFQLTVELFDYMDSELSLFEAVFASLDLSRAISMTQAGQCRLAPLTQVIQDSSHLYDYVVRLLFRLHSSLPADTLLGHRERFNGQFRRLRTYFHKSRNLQYFKRLIQIPCLPEKSPDFLRASALAEHVSPVVVIADEEEPEVEPEPEPQPLLIPEPSITEGPDEKDLLIETLRQEIRALRAELQSLKSEAHKAVKSLRERVRELEAELDSDRSRREHVQADALALRAELDGLRLQQAEQAQQGFTEAEKKVQASEQRYGKMKEKHTELVKTHAELLRKSAEVSKHLSEIQKEREQNKCQQKEQEQASDQAYSQVRQQVEEQGIQAEKLEQELHAAKTHVDSLKLLLQAAEQTNVTAQGQMASKESEREQLQKDMAELEKTLEGRKMELEKQSQQSVEELQLLQKLLAVKTQDEESLLEKLTRQRLALLKAAVTEAEGRVNEAMDTLSDPLHLTCKASPEFLLGRAQAALEATDKVMEGHSRFLSDPEDAVALLQGVSAFGYLLSDAMVQGSATSHQAGGDSAEDLVETCRVSGEEALRFLSALADDNCRAQASTHDVQTQLKHLFELAQALRPRGRDVQQQELGDLVEQEMATTSSAVEDAAARIEEMLNKSRAADTGVKLEVNERILASCTELMRAIKVLIQASKELQREIVESGRGAASPKEFYARNSRWTEGLISAAKAVGWGATALVEAADKAVSADGKFEELVVCSHEIAASTAQLVAASKVKAESNSKKLSQLKEASKHVNEATAKVVASTKDGKAQVEEGEPLTFTGVSLTQIKRQEMDCQVRLLELESLVQKERQRLGELRRKHYHLAGVTTE
uniref:huntingtin-interacting protein 1-related protein isoform X2 n=1 Tax=Myxine glutinosa TaxID=7769 RepID=UPI00358F16CE